MNEDYLDDLPDDSSATAKDEEGLEAEVAMGGDDDLTDKDEKEADELDEESVEDLAEEEDEDDDEDDEE